MVVASCPNFTVPNGFVGIQSGGSYAIIHCNFGFSLHGNFFLTCQSNGTWNHPVPTCGTFILVQYLTQTIENKRLPLFPYPKDTHGVHETGSFLNR